MISNSWSNCDYFQMLFWVISLMCVCVCVCVFFFIFVFLFFFPYFIWSFFLSPLLHPLSVLLLQVFHYYTRNLDLVQLVNLSDLPTFLMSETQFELYPPLQRVCVRVRVHMCICWCALVRMCTSAQECLNVFVGNQSSNMSTSINIWIDPSMKSQTAYSQFNILMTCSII